MRMRLHVLVAVVLALHALVGCAAPAPVYPASTEALERLVPAGVETLVVLELATMRASPALAGTIDALLGEDDRRILEGWLGTPLDRLDRAIVALFPRGFVVLIEGRALDAPRLVRDAGVRMGQIEVRDEQPFPRRIGRLGVERRELVALSTTRLAIGGEDGAAMLALLACARGEAEPVLGGTDARALRERLGDPALWIASLTPLTLPWETDVAVLLARHRVLGAGVVPLPDPARLALRVGIVGELPPGAEGNLRILAESFASSQMGALLGMREGDEALRVRVSDDGATIAHEIASAHLVSALRDVFRAEIAAFAPQRGAAP